MLNFNPITYDEVRAILKNNYHTKKGLKRKFLADAPFIKEFENIIKEGKGADVMSPLKILECAKLANDHYEGWVNSKRPKQPASIRCCLAILDAFQARLNEWLEKDDYRAFHDDLKDNAMIENTMTEIAWVEAMDKLIYPSRDLGNSANNTRQLRPGVYIQTVIDATKVAKPPVVKFILTRHLGSSTPKEHGLFAYDHHVFNRFAGLFAALFDRNEADMFFVVMDSLDKARFNGDVLKVVLRQSFEKYLSELIATETSRHINLEIISSVNRIIFESDRAWEPHTRYLFDDNMMLWHLIEFAYKVKDIDLLKWIFKNSHQNLPNLTQHRLDYPYDYLCNLMSKDESLDILNDIITSCDIRLLFQAAVKKNDVLLLMAIFDKYNKEIHEYLDEPEKKREILFLAVRQRSYEVLDWFIKSMPGYETGQMITSFDIHEAFIQDDTNRVELLKHFPALISDLIKYKNYQAFTVAIRVGDLPALNAFKASFPDQFDEMVSADNFKVLRLTFTNRDEMSGLAWLIDNVSQPLLQEMMREDSSGIRELFKRSARQGNLPRLQKMVECTPESRRSSLICTDEAEAFSLALMQKQWHVTLWLLNDASCLAYVEERANLMSPEYEACLSVYLRERMRYIKANLPPNADDLNLIRHALVMMRAFIRRGEFTRLSKLLAIPAFRAHAHEGIRSPGGENELLRLALRTHNGHAAAILLDVDEVARLASAANFYYQNTTQDNVGGQDDELRQLAEDRESSMREFTPEEKHCLERAMKHYQPVVDSTGVDKLLNQFRERIASDYRASPATFTSAKGKVVTLPLLYVDFKRLNLSSNDKKSALEAYYKHIVHGAYRYLSKPNPWMHPNAGFVNRDINDRSRGWSTFDRYQPLLVMVYLAALDTKTPCVNGFTLETKFEHLMSELALINRAHNWDKYQDRDDMEADRPSCSVGTPRRIFQSVPGNPLMVFLTIDTIKQEVASFAFNYFKSKLSVDNSEKIYTVMMDFIIDEVVDELSVLEPLNITAQAKAGFLKGLVEKYGDEYTKNPTFVGLVTEILHLDLDSPEVGKHYHAITLLGLTNLHIYLDKEVNKNKSKKPDTGVGKQGVFSNKEGEANADNPNDSEAARNKPGT